MYCKYHGVLKHGMIHDEVIVDIVSFALGYLTAFFEREHGCRTIADAENVACKP